METSSIQWLSEMGIEDHTFIQQCEMNSLDDLSTQEIAVALGEDFNHSFSSESFSSYSPFNPASNNTTAFSCSSMERPTKQLKTDSWNSCTTEPISTPERSSPNILSFGSPNSPTIPQHFYGNLVGAVKPKEEVMSARNITFASDIRISQGSYLNQNCPSKAGEANKRSRSVITKSPSQNQDHIIAERKRREKLSQQFIALSTIVPNLKKMDKISVLGDAIKHMKQLQEKVKTLEEQTTKKTMESVVFVKKSQLSSDDDISSTDENFTDNPVELLPEIEVRVSDRNVLIRIHCDKHKGILTKIFTEIEKLNLTVVNSNAMPFGNSALDITIVAQMDEEFCMTVKDLVKNLQSAFPTIHLRRKNSLNPNSVSV